MAKKTIVLEEFIDDLDGSKAEGTTPFSYEGTAYEIDLSKKNKTALDKLLKPYVEAARKVKAPRAARGTATARRSSSLPLAEIRAWAADNGIEVSSRGRIPGTVVEAYNAAH